VKTVAKPAPVTVVHEKDDRDHFTCCFDDNTAVCGADVTDAAWLDESPCPHCPLNILGGAL
jgi:hypothetical protein